MACGADRVAAALWPAGSDDLPRRPWCAVPAGARFLRDHAVREHDRRGETAHRRRLSRAGVSKFGRHFTNVVSPMVSNSPFVPGKWLRRAHCRDFPRDIRPSALAGFMAHVGGTTVEIVTPLVLLFSTNHWLTLAGVLLMVAFHLFITSTFPLAVPLEWNILFGYLAVFLFLGSPTSEGYDRYDARLARRRHRRRAGVLPRPGQLCVPISCHSCRRCASTRETGDLHSRSRGEAEHHHAPAVPQPDRPAARTRVRADIAEITLQQPVSWRSNRERSARPSSAATSVTATCTARPSSAPYSGGSVSHPASGSPYGSSRSPCIETLSSTR